jgi:hypothetical protein
VRRNTANAFRGQQPEGGHGEVAVVSGYLALDGCALSTLSTMDCTAKGRPYGQN